MRAPNVGAVRGSPRGTGEGEGRVVSPSPQRIPDRRGGIRPQIPEWLSGRIRHPAGAVVGGRDNRGYCPGRLPHPRSQLAPPRPRARRWRTAALRSASPSTSGPPFNPPVSSSALGGRQTLLTSIFSLRAAYGQRLAVSSLCYIILHIFQQEICRCSKTAEYITVNEAARVVSIHPNTVGLSESTGASATSRTMVFCSSRPAPGRLRPRPFAGAFSTRPEAGRRGASRADWREEDVAFTSAHVREDRARARRAALLALVAAWSLVRAGHAGRVRPLEPQGSQERGGEAGGCVHAVIRTHTRTDRASSRGLLSFKAAFLQWPREESNLRTRIRSPSLYPLSYGAAGYEG
jgi:hypothetical protein